MPEPLVDAWSIHDRIHAYILSAVKAPGLRVVPASGGRSVAQTFAHIHNVRLMWLEAAGAAIPPSAAKLDLDGQLTAAHLKKALKASGQAIAALISSGLAAGGRVKGFKPHVHAFVGYLISHESHHRGQVAMALKGAGMPLDRKVAYGIWEWGVR